MVVGAVSCWYCIVDVKDLGSSYNFSIRDRLMFGKTCWEMGMNEDSTFVEVATLLEF